MQNRPLRACTSRITARAALALLAACGGPSPSATGPDGAVVPPHDNVDPRVEPVDLASLTPDEQVAKLMELGEHVYKTGGNRGLACKTCHQEDGRGVPGVFPPLVGQKGHMGDCARHAWLVLNGLRGEIVVDGLTYNGVMTPQGALLTDLEIAAVITYERLSWGNDYGPCLPEAVAAVRKDG